MNDTLKFVIDEKKKDRKDMRRAFFCITIIFLILFSFTSVSATQIAWTESSFFIETLTFYTTDSLEIDFSSAPTNQTIINRNEIYFEDLIYSSQYNEFYNPGPFPYHSYLVCDFIASGSGILEFSLEYKLEHWVAEWALPYTEYYFVNVNWVELYNTTKNPDMTGDYMDEDMSQDFDFDFVELNTGTGSPQEYWSMTRTIGLIGPPWLDAYFDDGDTGRIIITSQCDLNLSYSGPQPVPEPATMLLLGSGLIGLAGLRRKFRKS